MMLFAHAGEDHGEAAVALESFLSAVGHLPTFASLLIIAFVLFGIYSLLGLKKINPLNRVLLLLPLLIAISIFYLQHNPLVAATVLSVGFVSVFFLAFALLSMPRQK